MKSSSNATQSSSPVSREELLRVARLVKVNIPDDDVDAYCQYLGDVVSWFGMLAEVNTDGVKPAINGGVPGALPMREDEAKAQYDRDDIFANAKETNMGFFVVKNVL